VRFYFPTNSVERIVKHIIRDYLGWSKWPDGCDVPILRLVHAMCTILHVVPRGLRNLTEVMLHESMNNGS